MKKLVITITNNISFDQRMIRIASTLSKSFDVTIVGANTRDPQALASDLPFKTKRLHIIFSKGKLFYAEYNLRLLFYLLRSKVDVLYTVDLDSMLAGICARKLKRFSWIYDAHEYFTELPEIIERPRTRRIWERIGDLGVPKVDLCLTVNLELAQILSKKYNVPFSSIRNVPSPQILGESPNNRKIIFYQGALNVGRGLEVMIDAMKSLPNFQLQIAGDGPIAKQLKQRAAASSLNNIEFLGNVLPRNLHKLTQKAFLGVNLLENKSLNYFYSLANKFFDYTMAGVPSLNMAFPAYQSLNKQYEVAVLFDELIATEIVKEIEALSTDTDRYAKLKAQCLKAREEWNWIREEGKLLEITSQYQQ